MIRIPGEIDRYIKDGKLKIALDKGRRVEPVNLSGISSNNLEKEELSKKESTLPFDNILQEEIKKILQNKEFL